MSASTPAHASSSIAATPDGYTPPLQDGDVEVSVVMPCLNEADTLAACIRRAQDALTAAAIQGEIVVADNGSSDGSPDIAREMGARVVHVDQKGYGSAIIGGIAAARGRYVVMGDADASYDFAEVPAFVHKLREGYALVQGSRLRAGGGQVLRGAMPFLHRWWGNPMFSWIARHWFGSPITDIHCGLRGFTRELVGALDQRCTGMEFASEMIIKATLAGVRIGEIPITLHPDGRRTHGRHLRTFRDGWRHLRFYLLFSPRWLFFIPGVVLIALGLVGYGIAMPALRIGAVRFDVHTLQFASLAVIAGFQAILFSAFVKIFAIAEGLLPPDPQIARWSAVVTLERGLLAGAAVMLAGLVLLGVAVAQWRAVHFGDLDYRQTMRWVIPGMTLATLGFQAILSSFFLSILGMHRR